MNYYSIDYIKKFNIDFLKINKFLETQTIG